MQVKVMVTLVFFGLLTIVFITLKLTDVIDWSWFWVLSPVIMPILITITILVGALSWKLFFK